MHTTPPIERMQTTMISVARSQTLSDIPRRSAFRYPTKLAIVHRDVELTFSQFDELVDRAAAAMHAAGLGKGDRVAILAHNCWQFPVVTFAAARIGAISVPINFMLNAVEVGYILDDCAAAAVVAEDALVPIADAAIADGAGSVRVRVSIDLSGYQTPPGWQGFDEWTRPGTPPEVVVSDNDVIRIMYTSGTESRPKGAMLTSQSLMWQYVSCVVSGEMSADDIEVHALPLYHCAQLDCFLSVDLYLGATSIILDKPDPETILRTVERERATKLFCPPTVWISLLRSPLFDHVDLVSLAKGYYGASALPGEVLEEMLRRVPWLRLWNFYGQTEMAPVATVLGPDEQVSRGGSAGRPALNVDTRIVDDSGQMVPTGEVGEIVHRSPQATVGYLNNPDKTAEAFAGGWFHSGDLGYLDDDGYLWVVDRKKDMIKTGGENVATLEVEEALYALGAVAEAAVFGVPHPRWIEAVTAVVVPRAGAEIAEEAVIAHCRTKLAGYKVPKYVLIVDELPKNPSGKILKRDLRATFHHLSWARK